VGTDFAGEVLRAKRASRLGLEPSLDNRVQRWWELRELDGVAWAIRTNDDAELEDAIRKLRARPILRGA